jgi:probable HAF family extracellular repeat protein
MVNVGNLGSSSTPAAVNDSGQVVGESLTEKLETHAFSWTPAAGIVDLGTLGGTVSRAAAVNNRGQVVGFSTTAGDAAGHAFSWTADGGMESLPELADGLDGGQANAINESGQIVGSSAVRLNVGHATMWGSAVSVPSAFDRLMAQVTAYGLPNGLTHALTVKLEAALASWQRGRSTAAANQIGAFVHEVNAKRGKALTDAEADTLIRIAEVLVQAIRTTSQRG